MNLDKLLKFLKEKGFIVNYPYVYDSNGGYLFRCNYGVISGFNGPFFSPYEKWYVNASLDYEYVASKLADYPYNKEKRFGMYPNPYVYKEFQEATKDKSNYYATKWKKRNNYKFTVVKCYDGNYELKKLTDVITIDGRKTYVIKGSDLSNFYVYDWVYYYTKKDMYNDIPLLALINHFWECEECGAITNNTEHICDNCITKYSIHSYDTKAEKLLSVKKDNKDPQLFGIELEYENIRDSKVAVVKSLKDHIILKRDGSLSSTGFEIVTTPASMTIHKEVFSKSSFWSIGKKAEASCGMHVHIGKAGMNEMQRGKILAFINDKSHYDKIVKIAGRDFARNRYCGYTENATITYGVYGDEIGVGRKGTDKYNAVNQSKSYTDEIRIFAAPKDLHEFLSRLEFVQALVDFTKPAVVGVKELTWQKFDAFVSKFKKIYPQLAYTMKGL